MKVSSNLGLICFSILGCNSSYATSYNSNECPNSEYYNSHDINSDCCKSNFSKAENWYSDNKVSDKYRGLRFNNSYKAVSASKLSDAQDLDNEVFSGIDDFFKKHHNPRYLVIFECDGITQTMHALNATKALTNIYYEHSKDLAILNKVNKWIGISYGCTLAGAGDGSFAKAKSIEKFNAVSNDIFTHLKEDRLSQNRWYSSFINCMFNGCLGCVKLNTENEDIDIIRASQFDRISPKSVQRYIADYFPRSVDDRLVFLESGKDRRRVDPNYQKSYVSIINSVNKTAKTNQQNVIRKNFGAASTIVANVVDTVKIPVASKIIGGINHLVADNVKFKTIDDTEHCDAYKEMSREVLSNGTLKLIINVDNYDGDEISSDLQIEHKPQDNKLKYRLTINIPYLSYQDKKYDFDNGYFKMLDYLNNDKVLPYLTSLFDFIHNINSNNEIVNNNNV